jgi:NAD-dependent DNA ligase
VLLRTVNAGRRAVAKTPHYNAEIKIVVGGVVPHGRIANRRGKVVFAELQKAQGVTPMEVIKFTYKDAKGNVTSRELVQWSENSLYLQGRSSSDTFPKTYRKDRIVEVLLGAELLLNDAAPPAPKLKPKPAPIGFTIAMSAAVASTPRPKTPSGGINQILFTGFAAAFRAQLEQQAQDFGLKVMKSPGKSLTFLCYGENAGPTKVAKAQDAGAFIIDSEQFLNLIETGELPW